MKNLSKLLFLILLAPFFSAAQTNYQPGVVVNLQGDTLRGLINYSEWENNPSGISFKPEQNSAPLKFTANDLKYFSVNVGHLAAYVRYVGPISTDNTEINHLSVGRDSSFKQDAVFLKILQEGKNLLLLSYSDDRKTRFFIARNFSEKPVELVYRIYYNSTEENGVDRTAYDYSYKGQLYQEAARAGVMNGALKARIQTSDYKEENLIYIAGIINGVPGTDLSKNNPSKPRPFNIAIAIAAIVIIAIWAIHDFASIHQQ